MESGSQSAASAFAEPRQAARSLSPPPAPSDMDAATAAAIAAAYGEECGLNCHLPVRGCC
jgi:hypothetical protein